jgi:hypothetical protein
VHGQPERERRSERARRIKQQAERHEVRHVQVGLHVEQRAEHGDVRAERSEADQGRGEIRESVAHQRAPQQHEEQHHGQ